MKHWLLFGGIIGLGILTPAHAQQVTCDINSSDFTECVQRRCAELNGQGRLCNGNLGNQYRAPAPVQNYAVPYNNSYPQPYGAYGAYGAYPQPYTNGPGAYGNYGYGGGVGNSYIPLEPSGTILIRPPYPVQTQPRIVRPVQPQPVFPAPPTYYFPRNP